MKSKTQINKQKSLTNCFLEWSKIKANISVNFRDKFSTRLLYFSCSCSLKWGKDIPTTFQWAYWSLCDIEGTVPVKGSRVMPLSYMSKYVCKFYMNAHFKDDWLTVTVSHFCFNKQGFSIKKTVLSSIVYSLLISINFSLLGEVTTYFNRLTCSRCLLLFPGETRACTASLDM